MRISELNNDLNIKKMSFAGNDEKSQKPLHIRYAENVEAHKKARKSGADEATFKKIKEEFDDISKAAENKIGKIKIPKIFEHMVKLLGKVKVQKTGNKAADTAMQLTKLVLWGNVGKELVGTGLYTTQALTNEDLPQDKRKFIGMYDLSVGLVSTAFSFIFGVGLQNSIQKGYQKLFKPLSEAPKASLATKSKVAAAIVGLSAFSSFFLQTIVGKRIIAPAIATPAASRLRKMMEEKEAAKKGADKKENETEQAKKPYNVPASIPYTPVNTKLLANVK